MKVAKLITILISTTLLSSMLYAKGMNPMSFKSLDTNQDGYITQEEFDSVKKARTMQKTNDGRLQRNAKNSLQFSELDTNSDDKVTEQELIKGQQLRRQNRQGNNFK